MIISSWSRAHRAGERNTVVKFDFSLQEQHWLNIDVRPK